VSLRFNIDLFGRPTIARMANHFQALVQAIVESPEQAISALPMLSKAERNNILNEWNQTDALYQDGYLPELIEAQMVKSPDAIVLVFEDAQLTCGEFKARTNQLASYLNRNQVGAEGQVGICMERSLEMVIAVVGVLKAGAAYVPIDPAYPAERQSFMLQDCQASVLLSTMHLQERLPGTEARVVMLDRDRAMIAEESAEDLRTDIVGDSLAYIIYTSGSTGVPKGAMNTHKGIANRLLWMQERYRLGVDDTVLQKTPFSFDVSVWELLWPLFTGARLVMARPGGHQESRYLIDLLTTEQVTTVHFVPSMLRLILEEEGLKGCPALKRVIASGEELSKDLEEEFFKKSGSELENLYGPTEAAVDVSYWRCQGSVGRARVPIGRPIGNVKLYILDGALEAVPQGVKGELMIGGMGPGRGYWNRADLTAEKFIPNCFGAIGGERIYRTGDLAKHCEGGQIEYLGRKDSQVKIRGLRIELGEVEAALCEHGRVKQAVVMVSGEGGDQRLVAYVVGELSGDGVDQLKGYLGSRLPEYMVPNLIMSLERMPLLPNGKIDRKALHQVESVQPRQYQAPETPTEVALAEMWTEVLKLDRVGISDDFFEVGGNSLSATRLVARINRAFDTSIPVRKVFERKTVADLALLIEETIIAEYLRPGE